MAGGQSPPRTIIRDMAGGQRQLKTIIRDKVGTCWQGFLFRLVEMARVPAAGECLCESTFGAAIGAFVPRAVVFVR